MSFTQKIYASRQADRPIYATRSGRKMAEGDPMPPAPAAPAPSEPAPEMLKVGDRVTVKEGAEHDEMTKGKSGEVVEISTPALGIKFDGEETTHKWYTDAELDKSA